jgi:hypothetical protein
VSSTSIVLSGDNEPSDRPTDDGLTPEEIRDRLFLERKVERAFYEAGRALRELRDRRLYRSTHGTFEDYCRDRFAHSRQRANFLIAGATVYENLTTIGCQNQEGEAPSTIGCQNPGGENLTTIGCQNRGGEAPSTIGCQNPGGEAPSTIGCQNPGGENLTTIGCQNRGGEDLTTISAQILPTTERQVRPLTQLEPQQQREVWREAVTESGGKVPSARVVSDIVQRIRERTRVPIAYRVGDVVEILVKDNPELRGMGGCWAIVSEVREFSLLIRAWNEEYTVREENLKDLGYSPAQREEVRKLSDRLTQLSLTGEETVKAIGAALGKLKRPYLTPLEEKLLAWLESESGVSG